MERTTAHTVPLVTIQHQTERKRSDTLAWVSLFLFCAMLSFLNFFYQADHIVNKYPYKPLKEADTQEEKENREGGSLTMVRFMATIPHPASVH